MFPLTRCQATARIAVSIAPGCTGHRSDGSGSPSPNGAAWSRSPVPRASASLRPGHDGPVFIGRLLAFQFRSCEQAVLLRPVVGFPDLRLLRGLRPAPKPSAGSGPARRRPGRAVGRAAPGRFPCSPCAGRLRRCAVLPLKPRHGYTADLPPGLLAGVTARRRSCLSIHWFGTRCCPTLIHQVGAGSTLEGVPPLVHSSLHIPVLLPGPGRLAVPTSLSGLLPPIPAPPGFGCPQLLTAAAATVGGSLIPLGDSAPRGARRRRGRDPRTPLRSAARRKRDRRPTPGRRRSRRGRGGSGPRRGRRRTLRASCGRGPARPRPAGRCRGRPRR